MTKTFKEILVSPQTEIKDVLEIINQAPHNNLPSGIALIVDDSTSLLGIVTDGDIRRALLENHNLNETVDVIMNKSPFTISESDSNNKTNILSLHHDKLKTIEHNILIVNENNQVVNIINKSQLVQKNTPSIAVIGLGYVGLTLAVSLAEVGFNVTGVDSNEEIVKKLNQGTPHIHEIGLDSLLKFHVGKNLKIQTTSSKSPSDVYILCVQTPIDDNNEPILDYLNSATEYVANNLSKNNLVIVRSTVPIGTTRNNIIPILEKSSGLDSNSDFYVASAPERTLAGKALKEIRELPQIIAGFNITSSQLTNGLFNKLTPTIINVDSLEEAELIKLMDNTFRDMIFAYSNQIALLADNYDIDTSKLIQAANEGYPRNNIPKPSPGVGGICLKKDPHILISSSKNTGYVPKLTELARLVNESMSDHIVTKIERFSKSQNKDVSKLKIFVMGFAFKGNPETSDTRQSATLDVTNKLSNVSNNIFGYDPVVSTTQINSFNVQSVSIEDGFKNADCVLIMNNHDSYSKLDVYSLLSTTNQPCMFFDGWSLFGREMIEKIDHIEYQTI
ncbi:MAG: hypothetical protein CMO19_02545 [Thaumarchaeota archaeon]|nr:hypothetical protein [Nitrososphaerota archaeon]|tara:strand:- start:6840 stop:8522 length:1683 start_codon:yes stop_codon:yes gene_type:complete